MLNYHCFLKKYKIIAVDLSKQEALDADLRSIQTINFTENFDCAAEIRMFFILEETKETILDFSQETLRVL